MTAGWFNPQPKSACRGPGRLPAGPSLDGMAPLRRPPPSSSAPPASPAAPKHYLGPFEAYGEGARSGHPTMGQTLAAQAAICRDQGRPFVFPGSETQWNVELFDRLEADDVVPVPR